jgi:hypothetical protein
LGAGELGGGDNLHGLGDLLDVANGLETAFDFTEGGIVRGGNDGGPARGRSVRKVQWRFFLVISRRAGVGFVGWERDGAYRVVVAAPARRAGRTALVNMVDMMEWR